MPKEKDQLDPNSMTVTSLAKMLTREGDDKVTPKIIRANIAAGAPTNPDGTMNLIHYAAWLTKEMTTRGDGPS